MVAFVWAGSTCRRHHHGLISDFGLDPQRCCRSGPGVALHRRHVVWKHVASLSDSPGGCNHPARDRGSGPPRWRWAGCVFLLHHPSSDAACPGALYDPDTIGAFQMFDAAFVMTVAGHSSADDPGLYIYQRRSSFSVWDYGATIAFVLFLIILVVTLIQRRVLRGMKMSNRRSVNARRCPGSVPHERARGQSGQRRRELPDFDRRPVVKIAPFVAMIRCHPVRNRAGLSVRWIRTPDAGNTNCSNTPHPALVRNSLLCIRRLVSSPLAVGDGRLRIRQLQFPDAASVLASGLDDDPRRGPLIPQYFCWR